MTQITPAPSSFPPDKVGHGAHLRDLAGGRDHPARVIDELMGPYAGKAARRGSVRRRGSLISARYCWTTPELQARVVAVIEQRLALSFAVAAQANR